MWFGELLQFCFNEKRFNLKSIPLRERLNRIHLNDNKMSCEREVGAGQGQQGEAVAQRRHWTVEETLGSNERSSVKIFLLLWLLKYEEHIWFATTTWPQLLRPPPCPSMNPLLQQGWAYTGPTYCGVSAFSLGLCYCHVPLSMLLFQGIPWRIFLKE